MKTPAILLLLVFLWIFPSVAQEELFDSSDSAAKAAIDTTYVLSVTNALPDLRFHYRAVPDSELTIVVTRAQEGDTIQTINDFFAVRPEQLGESEQLLMMDVNYDGYDDLMLLTAKHPVLGSESYSYWLFDPQSRLFKRNEKLSELLNENPEFDTRHKIVKTHSVGYPFTPQRDNDTYKFMQGAYVLIRRLKHDWLPELDKEGNPQWIWTLEEWQDGKLEMVAKQLDSASHEVPEWARELE